MGEMAEFNGSPVVGLTGGALVAPHNYRADGMPWVHPWRDWSVLPVVESEEMARLHPVTAYLAKLAPGSRASQRSKLNRTAQLLSGGQHRTAETYPWHRLTNVDMQALRSHLAATRHHATATNYLTAVRSLLKMCRRLGLMSADACNAALDLDPIPGNSTDDRPGRHVGRDEMARLFAYLDSDESASAQRMSAALAILRSTGMRRAGLLALQLSDYDPAEGTLRVQGKGGKVYTAFLAPGHQARLERWLDGCRGRLPGYIICPVDKWGTVNTQRQLDPSSFHEALTRTLDAAGVAHFSAHDLRRTMAGDLLSAGRDIAEVMKAGAWNTPAMVARYDRRGDRGRREMAAVLDL